VHQVFLDLDDDDDVYVINYNIAVGHKMYLQTNTDHPKYGISTK
jgi:hypothetical protein